MPGESVLAGLYGRSMIDLQARILDNRLHVSGVFFFFRWISTAGHCGVANIHSAKTTWKFGRWCGLCPTVLRNIPRTGSLCLPRLTCIVATSNETIHHELAVLPVAGANRLIMRETGFKAWSWWKQPWMAGLFMTTSG